MKKLFVTGLVLIFFIVSCTSKEPVIVLSFDTEYPYGIGFPDDWGEQKKQDYTPSKEQWENTIKRINEIGIKHKVKFQFNIVGRTAEDNPDLVRELKKKHDISCHSYSHKNQLDLGYEGKISELNGCKKALEGVLGEKIRGNRFPYTKYDEDSIRALKEAGYEWDSSIWKDKASLRAYNEQGIIEYPLNPATDDWDYFIKNEKKDAEQFFKLLEQDIITLSENSVYIIILHPWVLALDQARAEALDGFVERHKNIKSIDEMYLEGKNGN